MKKDNVLLRWIIAVLYLVLLAGTFLTPYSRVHTILPDTEQKYSLVSIMLKGFQSEKGLVLSVFIAGMLLLVLITVIFLCLPEAKLKPSALLGRNWISIGTALLSGGCHIILIKPLTEIVDPIYISKELSWGFYFNVSLIIISIPLLLICVMQPSYNLKKPTVKTSANTTGVIIGVTGMYENAIMRIADGEELIIGRDSTQSNIVVDTESEKISRKHCSVSFNAKLSLYFVTDFSKNGTFKDDYTRLPGQHLYGITPGTVIYLGNKKNSFKLGITETQSRSI